MLAVADVNGDGICFDAYGLRMMWPFAEALNRAAWFRAQPTIARVVRQELALLFCNAAQQGVEL